MSKKNKKNKNKLEKIKNEKHKYNYYWNKYIEDLGYKYEETDIRTWVMGKNTRKIKKKTGIDYRECYNLDDSIAMYIYSRLKAYKRYTITDLEYEDKDYGEFNGTLKEGIDIVLKGLKLYLKDNHVKENYLDKCKKYLGIEEVPDYFSLTAPCMVFSKAMKVLADIGPALWD